MDYVFGIDYGTLSARGILVELESGRVAGEAVYEYPHGVMTPYPDAALQDPADYLQAISHVSKTLLALPGVSPEQVKAVGLDFTAATVMPVDETGTPLCQLPEFENDPHAFVKLWKHHGGIAEADAITELAKNRGEVWLDYCGGRVSSELFFPKVFETFHKSPAVYARTHRFTEAADWVVRMLTGEDVHSGAIAGFKCFWSEKRGFPSNDFWTQLDPGLDGLIGGKISENIKSAGQMAGRIDRAGAALTGLPEGTPVAVPIIDAHAGMPATGAVLPGMFMLILGTSNCHMVMDPVDRSIPNIFSSAYEGVMPGLSTHEAGQSGAGDMFAWFMENCVPSRYAEEAKAAGRSLFSLMDEKAAALGVGGSKVLALDWWNGNRCPYADFSLSGVWLGMNLQTKPEQLYRALLESLAYGTQSVLDIFRSNGVDPRQAVAAGGIGKKNPLLMQIMADVLNLPIRLTDCAQAGALGSAIAAAAVSGRYESLSAAVDALADKTGIVYEPIPENVEIYRRLYEEYRILSRYFGEENKVMYRLRDIGNT